MLKDFELVWIVTGSAVAWFDGRRIAAPAGTVLLCHPGTQDAYDWSATSETVHAFIHLGIGHLGVGWPAQREWPRWRAPPPSSLIFSLFRHILGLSAADDGTVGALLQPSLDLLLRVFVMSDGDLPVQLHDELPLIITEAFNFLRARLRDEPNAPIPLVALARAVHVSSQHLCRVFRRRLGVGPMTCVRLMRIEQAASWLERTDDPVGVVGERAGFASPYHFSKVFKRVYGKSPKAYRLDFQKGLKNGLLVPRKPAVYGAGALSWLLWG